MDIISEDVNMLILQIQWLNCKKSVPQLSTDDHTNDHHKQNMIFVGKVFWEKIYSQTTIQASLTKAWKTREPFSVLPKGKNNFIFSFGHYVDANDIL